MTDTTEKANGFDLAALDTAAQSDEGALMEVRHPGTGETLRFDDGRAFTIKVLGRDSQKFVQASRVQADRRLQMIQRTRQPILSATIEKDDIELLVQATLDWDLIIGGQKPDATHKNFRDAYTKYRWLKEQVDEFVGNRANFTKG